MSRNSISRRTVLAGLGAVAVGGVAGCTGVRRPVGGTDGGTGSESHDQSGGGAAGPASTAPTPTGTAGDPTRTTTTGETVDATPLETFESGQLTGDTWVASQLSATGIASGQAAFQGEHGVRLQSGECERIASGPAVSDPLSDYPAPGDTFDVFHRLANPDFGSNEDSWVYFGLGEYPTSDGYTNDAYDRGYALRNDAAGSALELRRVGAGQSGVDSTVLDRTDHSYDAETWYRIAVEWSTSPPEITATLYAMTTDDRVGTQVARVQAQDATYASEGGVVLVTEQGGHFDLLRRIDGG